MELKHLSNNEANRITREAICTALLYLMDTKEFDRISISELARKAGVSRQSFYRNYSSKEDIVIEIEENLLSVFEDSLNDPKHITDIHLWFYDLFCFVRENRKLILVLQRADLMDVLFSKASFLAESWMGKRNARMHYYIIGSLAAIKAVVMEWISTGMKESCNKMADICMEYDINTLFP